MFTISATPTPQPPIHKPTTPTHVLPYTLSPSISPASLRRRNSAPNTESATDLGKGSRFAATTVTHTHSTSSLQHFVSSLSQPCVDDVSTSQYTYVIIYSLLCSHKAMTCFDLDCKYTMYGYWHKGNHYCSRHFVMICYWSCWKECAWTLLNTVDS